MQPNQTLSIPQDSATDTAAPSAAQPVVEPTIESIGAGILPILQRMKEGKVRLPTNPGEGLPKPRPEPLKGKITTEQVFREMRGE